MESNLFHAVIRNIDYIDAFFCSDGQVSRVVTYSVCNDCLQLRKKRVIKGFSHKLILCDENFCAFCCFDKFFLILTSLRCVEQELKLYVSSFFNKAFDHSNASLIHDAERSCHDNSFFHQKPPYNNDK